MIPPEYFDANGNYVGRPAGRTLKEGIVGAVQGIEEKGKAGRIIYLKERLKSGIATPSEVAEARKANLVK